MILAGGQGKIRGIEQNLRAPLRHQAIKLREAQVVADGQPKHAQLRLHRHNTVARGHLLRLPHRLAGGQNNIEGMQLAVFRQQLTLGGKQKAGVVHPRISRDFFGPAAAVKIDPKAFGRIGNALVRFPGLVLRKV